MYFVAINYHLLICLWRKRWKNLVSNSSFPTIILHMVVNKESLTLLPIAIVIGHVRVCVIFYQYGMCGGVKMPSTDCKGMEMLFVPLPSTPWHPLPYGSTKHPILVRRMGRSF